MIDELRIARPGDADALAGLLSELGYPTTGTELRFRLDRWLDRRDRTLLVAEGGARLLGLLALTVTPRLESDASWAQVVALVVTASARGRGVGRALLDRAQQIAVASGCDAVVVNSSRRRTGAHAFYESVGFRDRCTDHAQFFRALPAVDHRPGAS